MSEARKTAQRIFREWCEGNGVATDPVCAADLVSRIATEIEGLHAQRAAARSALAKARTYIEYALDTHGNDVAGTGLAALNAIDATLAQEPAGQSEALDEKKLLARVAAIICEETCGLTSECKSREAAKALLDKGYLAGSASPGVTAGASYSPDVGKAISQFAAKLAVLCDENLERSKRNIEHELLELFAHLARPYLDRAVAAEAALAAHPTVKVSGDAAEMRERAAQEAHAVASAHAHHALWVGIIEYGWDEATERFGRALAYRIADTVRSGIRALPLTPEGLS